jgi:hypothetical protein
MPIEPPVVSNEPVEPRVLKLKPSIPRPARKIIRHARTKRPGRRAKARAAAIHEQQPPLSAEHPAPGENSYEMLLALVPVGLIGLWLVAKNLHTRERSFGSDFTRSDVWMR